MKNNITIAKGGAIEVKRTKRGLTLYAYNFEHGETIPIGSIDGARYEVEKPILEKPEPSFAFSQSELAAVEEVGASLIGIIQGKRVTHAISLKDFKRYMVPYHNRRYGKQWRVSVTRFQHSNAVVKRNPRMDNPVLESSEPISVANSARQLGLFG